MRGKMCGGLSSDHRFVPSTGQLDVAALAEANIETSSAVKQSRCLFTVIIIIIVEERSANEWSSNRLVVVTYIVDTCDDIKRRRRKNRLKSVLIQLSVCLAAS